MVDSIDFNEEKIMKIYPELMDILLSDHSSRKNIKWCTDNYKKAGIKFDDFMIKETFFYRRSSLIKPRILKSLNEQKKRSKDMAEVFTPSWVCNLQNNVVDNEWFGYKDTFNIELEKKWKATPKVLFLNGLNWQQYVELERMEMACGEAPYLTSRYDTTNGVYIPTNERIGLLDRKLRVISENVDNEVEWVKWATVAYQRIYGFEYQGDNLLIARENLLMTFLEFYKDKFDSNPSNEDLKEIANIISWNIFQMDGLKFVIPNSCHVEERMQLSLFPELEPEPEICLGCKTGNIYKHNGIYCKVKDWKKNKTLKFIDLIKGGKFYA